jgi:hypothetical protein
MMEFEEIKIALVNLLGAAAGSRFQVIGYQRQSKSADEVENNNRLVQVYYSDGDFPKTGRMHGAKTHDCNFEVDLTASAAAEADLNVLDSETATEQMKAAALIALKTAAEVADTKIDELIRYVFGILMDARNLDIGLAKGRVTNRWIGRIQKDTMLERGSLVVKTANLKYSCRVQEEVNGDIGNVPDPVIIESDVPAGDTAGAGVTVNQ